jgi:hypothetical protein
MRSEKTGVANLWMIAPVIIFSATFMYVALNYDNRVLFASIVIAFIMTAIAIVVIQNQVGIARAVAISAGITALAVAVFWLAGLLLAKSL